MSSMKEKYTVTVLCGDEIKPILPFIAKEGPKGYQSYPYLYEANEKDVLNYLQWFSLLPQAVFAIAHHGNEPVGFAIGTALTDYAVNMFPHNYEESMNAFRKQGRDPNTYYYIADMIVLPEHDSEWLTSKLYGQLEEYARVHSFEAICFAALAFDTHPLKPNDYQEPDAVWKSLGYSKSNLTVRFTWKTFQPVGPAVDQEHELAYWIKELR